jgi:hypothetical protein
MALSPSTESVTHIFGVPSAGTPFRSNGEQRLRRESRDEEKGGGLIVAGGLDIRSDLSFRIDHPLAPQTGTLCTPASSSERKNVYDGVARLNEDGAAWVELPEWFDALNGDLRYQLTAIGGAAPNLHVAEEISENRFKIAGGERG